MIVGLIKDDAFQLWKSGPACRMLTSSLSDYFMWKHGRDDAFPT
jgi:hypothetical protein